MSYEDILIRESTGEGMGQPPWCSACERDADDCVCPEPLSGKLVERFNEGWFPEVYSGCWLWFKAMNDHGYGQMWDGERVIYAHRFSWTLFNGEIPEGMQILHRCDTPKCVNPDHLFLGTRFDNMRDCVNKRRGNTCKLSAAQVIEVRASTESSKVIAKRFGMSKDTINKIRSGKIWPQLCAQCEKPISQCACEELSDHFRSVCSDSDGDVRVFPAPSEFPLQLMYPNFPVPVLDEPDTLRPQSGVANEGEALESTNLIRERSGADSRGGENSFTQWLEAHGDYLPLPNSFREWLDRGNDAI